MYNCWQTWKDVPLRRDQYRRIKQGVENLSNHFLDEMSDNEILQVGNPILWQKSVEVDNARAVEIQVVIRDLSDTLAAFRQATGYGRGISAPQIGTLKRAIFIRMQPSGYCGALINPSIVWESESRFELWDDCFSFPDLLVRVSRAAEIRVEYLDDLGTPKTLRLRETCLSFFNTRSIILMVFSPFSERFRLTHSLLARSGNET